MPRGGGHLLEFRWVAASPTDRSMSASLSASKNTDSSVFYTEIETKILNTDSNPKNTDRDPI